MTKQRKYSILAIVAVFAIFISSISLNKNIESNLLKGFLSVPDQQAFTERLVSTTAFESKFDTCPNPMAVATNSAGDLNKQKEVINTLLSNNTDSNAIDKFFQIVDLYNNQTTTISIDELVDTGENDEDGNPITEVITREIVSPLLHDDFELETIQQGAGFIVYEDIQKLSLIYNAAIESACSGDDNEPSRNANLINDLESTKEDLYFSLNYKELNTITANNNSFISQQDLSLPAGAVDAADINFVNSDIGSKVSLFDISQTNLLIQSNQSNYNYQSILLEVDPQTITALLAKNLLEAIDFSSQQSGTQLNIRFQAAAAGAAAGDAAAATDTDINVIHKTASKNVRTFSKQIVDITSLQNVELDFRKDYLLAIEIESQVPPGESNFADGPAGNKNRSKILIIHVKDRLQAAQAALSAQAASQDTVRARDNNTVLFELSANAEFINNLPENLELRQETIKLELSKAGSNKKIIVDLIAVTPGSLLFEANNNTANLENGTYDASIIVFETQKLETNKTFEIRNVVSDGDDGDSDDESDSDIQVDAQLVSLLSADNVSLEITGENLPEQANKYIFTLNDEIITRPSSVQVDDTQETATLNLGDMLACHNSSCSAIKLNILNAENELELETDVLLEIAKQDLLVEGGNTDLIQGSFICLEAVDKYQVQISNIETQQKLNIITPCKTISQNDLSLNLNSFDIENTFSPGFYTFKILSDNSSISQHESRTIEIKADKELRAEKLKNNIFKCSNNNTAVAGSKISCETSILSDQLINREILIFIEGTEPHLGRRLIRTNTNTGTVLKATGILVPDETNSQPSILLVDRNSLSETNPDIFRTSSFIDIIDPSDRNEDGITTGSDKLDAEITPEFEIGDNINFDIEVPNFMNLGLLQLSYQGHSSDRNTRGQKGALYTYCSQDFVRTVSKNFVRKACNRFTREAELQGPDLVMIENYNTSKIQTPGTYNLKIVGINLSPEGKIIKYVEIIEKAFRAQPKIYMQGSSLGMGFPYYSGQGTGGPFAKFFKNKHQNTPPPNPKCMVLYTDMNMNNPICNDLVYLHELGVYKGQFANAKQVSNYDKAATNAHLFSFTEKLLEVTQKLPLFEPNADELIAYINDIDAEVIANANNHWWLVPAYSLLKFGVISPDANGNLNAYQPLRQIQAAQTLLIAAKLLEPQADLSTQEAVSSRVRAIQEKFQELSLTINPEANATIGDLVAMTARLIRAARNPYLFQTQNTQNRVYQNYNYTTGYNLPQYTPAYREF